MYSASKAKQSTTATATAGYPCRRTAALAVMRKKELLGMMYVRGGFINPGRKYGNPITLGLTGSSENEYLKNSALLCANGVDVWT